MSTRKQTTAIEAHDLLFDLVQIVIDDRVVCTTTVGALGLMARDAADSNHLPLFPVLDSNLDKVYQDQGVELTNASIQIQGCSICLALENHIDRHEKT